MDKLMVKKIGFLPKLIISLFLLAMTVGVSKVEASPVSQNLNGTQLAWGMYLGPVGWYGGWGPGYYNRWGYYHGPVCASNCWRNRWGHLRCNRSCYY